MTRRVVIVVRVVVVEAGPLLECCWGERASGSERCWLDACTCAAETRVHVHKTEG